MSMPGAGPELTIGQHLELRLATDAGRHALRTTLERYDTTEGRLLVTWPTEHLRLFPLRPGQHIEVELARPDDALYSVESVLEAASMEEPPHLVLRLRGEWQRAQRRRALRRVIDMRPSEATRYSADGDRAAFEAIILDLSSGGLRVQSASELTLGDELELTFGTPSGGAQLRVRVNVLRVAPPPTRGDVWDGGCQFVEPSLGEREQIVQFILAQQNAVARSASAEQAPHYSSDQLG